MSKAGRLLSKHLRNWHYTTGAVFALIFSLLAGTGVLINHAHHLHLDQKTVPWLWLNQFYGLDSKSSLRGYSVDTMWFTKTAGHVFLNQQKLAPCKGQLVGAAVLQQDYYVLCADELLLVSEDGQIVESWSGFSQPFAGLAIDHDTLLALGKRDHLIYRFDEDFAQWQETTAQNIDWPKANELPKLLSAELMRQLPSSLTWERVLLDVHSGRIAGGAGTWFMDLAALALMFSSISGVWLWFKRSRNKRR